ncbi:MAG TPA: VOC family protein [Polyangiaceae bacterium]|jgi:lactoylglutathione lyase
MIVIDTVDHLGIRVADEARSIAFYAQLGFELVYRADNGDPVVVLRNQNDVEINLIVNAAPMSTAQNVLMDIPEKHAGYTHVALRVTSIEDTVAELARLGVPLSGGPQRLGSGISLFIRDPDRNVIELRARATRNG